MVHSICMQYLFFHGRGCGPQHVTQQSPRASGPTHSAAGVWSMRAASLVVFGLGVLGRRARRSGSLPDGGARTIRSPFYHFSRIPFLLMLFLSISWNGLKLEAVLLYSHNTKLRFNSLEPAVCVFIGFPYPFINVIFSLYCFISCP